LNDWAVVFTLICYNFRTTFYWLIFKNLGGLPDIGRLIFPNKEERNTFESVDEGEKEMLNEILMMDCFEVIQ
jgi:hypothetical protein